jgi:hypothetical protein
MSDPSPTLDSSSNPNLAAPPCHPALQPTAMLHIPNSHSSIATSAVGSDVELEDESSSLPQREVDPQILEALRSKDRLYVLKLGEWIESIINDKRYEPAT